MRQGVDHRVVLLLLFTVFGSIPTPTPAQERDTLPPPADPADVGSVDGIIAAVYDVISGPAGQARNWDRWRQLFIPEARLISVGRTEEGGYRYIVMSPEDYVRNAGTSLERNGFFEDEIGRTQEEFGPIVHLFSAYQSKRNADDPEPFARGINSFQLMHDGSRWWVVTIYWKAEGPELPIPEKYLGAGAPHPGLTR